MKMLSLIFLSVLLNVATATNPPQAFWAAYRTQMKEGFENFAFLPHVDEITLEAKDFVEGGYAKKVATYYSTNGPTDVNPITDKGPGVFLFAGVGSTTTQAIAVEYDLTKHHEVSHGVSHSVTSPAGKTLGQSFGAKDPTVARKQAQQLLADLLHTQKAWDKKSAGTNTVPVIFGKSISSGLKSGVSSNGQLIRLIDIDEDDDVESGQAGTALKLLVIAAKTDYELNQQFIKRGIQKSEKTPYITKFYLQPKVGFKHDAGAFPNFGVWFVRTLNRNKELKANIANQKLLPGVNGKGPQQWAPIKAVGDVGGGTTRTIVKWKDNGGVDFGKEDGLTANKLYETAIKVGEGNAQDFATVYGKDYNAALAAAYQEEDIKKKWKSILSIMVTKDYITALGAASVKGDNEKWKAIGVALAKVIHSEMEIAGIEKPWTDEWRGKLPIVVLQTGAMRRDYFNPAENDAAGKQDALRKPESIMGKSAAHSAYYDEYYYHGDQDYDYDEYDEGYDDDEYSLYEEAAANVRRAREEFRIAQQLRNWKGRGNSRLLSRYYH